MDKPEIKVRIDKWLWGVRLYKTRSLATDACERGRVEIKEITVKPGRAVRAGDVIRLHRGVWYQTVRVIQLTQNRMSASIVKDFCEDITPQEEIEKLKTHQAALASWGIKPGAGRPTKKDRREMDDFLSDW